MSSSFKFHSSVPEIIPWQAQYNFPSQSNKVRKQTVKLVPKNGYNFNQNQIVRFEFPADGYCNMLNTSLSFDVNTNMAGCTLTAGSGTVVAETPYVALPRGGAHNFFKRVRVLYGSLVLEDIQEYKTLARMFTEMGVEKSYQQSTGSILDGHAESAMRNIGNPFGTIAPNDSTTETDANLMSNAIVDNQLVMLDQVGGQCRALGTTASTAYYPEFSWATDTAPVTGNTATDVVRTFNIQLLTGLTSLKKLLPLKWMASQLVIELTIAPVAEAYITNIVNPLPTVTLQNMNMVTELLEFDSSYDLAFFEGLNQPTGVPLKFTSWHYHQFAITGNTQTYQIHERSRSVKSAFAVIRMLTPIPTFDADWFFHNINDSVTLTNYAPTGVVGTGYNGLNYSVFSRGAITTQAGLTGITIAATQTAINLTAPVQQYQWRIGGQYYPAQPVRVTSVLGNNLTGTGAFIARGEEAYAELMKAVNSLGDCTVSGGIHYWNYTITGTNGLNGEGSKFIMGTSFETPGLGPESINGINAEEQSDLALTIYGNQGGAITTTSATAKKLEVFVNYDCLLLVRSGNVVDLVL
jgi:hypothetical protein